MADETPVHPAPQFDVAQYKASASGDSCKTCGVGISGEYYRVNGAMTCPRCAEQARASLPKENAQAYGRGLLFGIGAAILGLILYAAVGIITGLEIGFVSLAVGYLVGKGILKGSRGYGGRRYQITAVLLTYAAVSMAAVPIGLSQLAKQERAAKQAQGGQSAPASATNSTAGENESGKPPMGFAAALGELALLGLASPFLGLEDPVRGGIGLIILFVGIQIAWKLTAAKPPMDIAGPFRSRSVAAQT